MEIIVISYKMKFIDGARFMASSLSNLVDNLAEGIHITKCKHYDYFLEKDGFNDISIKYKCLYCNKDYPKKINEGLKKRLKNTLKSTNMMPITLS